MHKLREVHNLASWTARSMGDQYSYVTSRLVNADNLRISLAYDSFITKNFGLERISTGFIAFLHRVLGVLNPGVSILIRHQLNVLRYECPTCNRNCLIPRFVVDLREGVCVSNELTGGPFCELAIVPCKIALFVVFQRVLKWPEIEYSPGSNQIAAEFCGFLSVNTETWELS